MRHPDERQIALYAGGEAGWGERFWMGRHVANCPECRRLADGIRRDRQAIREEAAELPQGLNWDRLAAEMTANIHVGLEAGECVGGRQRRVVRVTWRPALAAAGLAALLVGGFYLNVPADQRSSLGRGVVQLWDRLDGQSTMHAGISLESTRNGIQVSENGAAMTMMNPSSEPAVVVVNTRGSLRARYVDDDTGQVTITNVYAQ